MTDNKKSKHEYNMRRTKNKGGSEKEQRTKGVQKKNKEQRGFRKRTKNKQGSEKEQRGFRKRTKNKGGSEKEEGRHYRMFVLKQLVDKSCLETNGMQRMGVQGSGNRFPSTFQGVSSKDMYPFTICGQGPPLKRKALSPLVHKMWRNEAIEIVRDASSPDFYSRLFNTFLEIPHFKMETAESIRRSLPREAWVTSIDLINAYFHITINQVYPKFLRSQTRDTLYQFTALLFGLSPAP